MDAILKRQWRSLDYRDPRPTLKRLRVKRRGFPAQGRGDPLHHLRSGRDRLARERHQAALLAHGIAQAVLKRKVRFALSEDADYDCVFRWHEGPSPTFMPVQLKEVVPDTLNPDASLDEIVQKLTRYAASSSLVVGIHLNRLGIDQLDQLDVPDLNLRELWVFGATGRAPNEWAIYGNVLDRPKLYVFEYP